MSSKKITYSNDFKVKVLDYYFKHGGDDKFGLKKKTAGHFNIDKKTINRMLNNPEMVKRARKLISSRKSAASSKPPTASRPPVKPAVRKAGSTPSKVNSSSSRSASSSQSSASSSSSNKASTSSTTSTKSVSSSSKQVNSTNSGSNRTPQKSKPGIPEDSGSPGVEVFELPEDPDYSLLKRSINAATNGVGGLAKLLVTGTEEVRNVVLNECDVILECKVCRGLFRSVVNFLAHKRIYCQDEFADVRTLFHKGDIQGLTSQSGTVVVEPEPPPDGEEFNTMRTMIPTTYSSIRSSQGKAKRSGIDSIALKLARKRKAYHASSTSSSISTGSSSYYKSLNEVTRCRDKLSRDCSVVLEDIGGVTNAVFQSFVPPGCSSPSTSMSSLVDEASHSKSGVTVAINQNGEIVKTASGEIVSMEVDQPSDSSDSKDLTCLLCNTRFATQKTLSVHQRSHHGFERCIYSCPICQASFLSMWAVVKHLQRTHKKTKSQIERLRKVVKKNIRKKIIYQKTEKDKDHPVSMKDGDEEEEDEEDEVVEEEEEEKVEESGSSSVKSSEITSPKKSGGCSSLPVSPVKLSPVKGSSHKNETESSESAKSPDHCCKKCERKFSTSLALESHGRFCSLLQRAPPETPMNPLLRPEIPEKKIAIQIRKDYKKSATPSESNIASNGDTKDHQVMFKVPKTAQERENLAKIEEMMGEFCNLSDLSCIPCGRKYHHFRSLQRHASNHMDWTRFQCSLCHYKHFVKHEVIKHYFTKHNVNATIAGSMVIETESVGQLKYFLDNEDAVSISSDVDQDNLGDPLKEKSSVTVSDCNTNENKVLTPVNTNAEKRHLRSKSVDQNILNVHKIENGESSKEYKSAKVKTQDLTDSCASKVKTHGLRESNASKVKPQDLIDTNASKVKPQDLTNRKASKVKTQDMTDSNASKVKTHGLTDSSASKVKTQDLTDSNASKVKTKDLTDSNASKVKTHALTDSNASKVKSHGLTDSNACTVEHSDSKETVIPTSEIDPQYRETNKSHGFETSENNHETIKSPAFESSEIKPKISKSQEMKTSEIGSETNKSPAFEASKIKPETNKGHPFEVFESKPETSKIHSSKTLGMQSKTVKSPSIEPLKIEPETNKSHPSESLENKSKCIIATKMTDSNTLTEEEKPDSSNKTFSETSLSVSLDGDVKDVRNSETCSYSSGESNHSLVHKVERSTRESEISKVATLLNNEEQPSIPQKTEQSVSQKTEYSSKEIKISECELSKIKSNPLDEIKKSSSSDHCSEVFHNSGVKITKDNDSDTFSEKLDGKHKAPLGGSSKQSEPMTSDKESESLDSESVSSNVEASEQGSVIVSSENTLAVKSHFVIDCVADETNTGIESEVLIDRTVELENKLTKGKIDCEIHEERASIVGIEGTEQTVEDDNLPQLCSFMDGKPSELDIFGFNTDINPIPKDDLSLDFLGFPSTKEENFGRPARVKRSVEHKDFIYEIKRPISQTSSSNEDDCIILPSEEGRASLRRRSSLKLETVSKKSRTEGDGYRSQSCNGDSLSCSDNMNSENYSASQKKEADPDELESSRFGTTSTEKRKVRVVHRKSEGSPRGGLTHSVEENKSKSGETLKGKNFDKVSEISSNLRSSKKESPTLTRCSSRLLANSPLPKKEKRQDTLKTRIFTNGQGQSNPIGTTNKVKL